MFGYGQENEGFPSRSNKHLENLMSLNTLDPVKSPSRPPINPRSLRTDDIEGAKPKSSARRGQEPVTYSGLNLPSYSKPLPRSPVPGQVEINQNAGNFFGSTPPISPKVGASKLSPGPDVRAAANFYGATPPRSRAQDPYSKPDLPPAELAKFYGVTPVQSRGGREAGGGIDRGSKVPDKDLAGFFGVTPQGTGYKEYKGTADAYQLPPKEVAGFYGATPPRSRQPGQSNYPRPERLSNSPSKFSPPVPVPNNAASAFFGATPAGTGRVPDGKDAAGFFGVTPTGNFYGGPTEAAKNVPLHAASKFFGATPQNTGYNQEAQIRPRAGPAGPIGKGNAGQVPSDEIAKFFGSTPPATSTGNDRNNQGLSPKDLANFYGVTPPPSRPLGKATGAPDVMNQGRGQNIFSDNNKLKAKPEGFGKDLAGFYGATPPPSGRSPVYGTSSTSPVISKAVANFYGVTPPPTGQAKILNSPGKAAYNFSNDAAGFFGSDPVAPEFQHAAEIATKPKFNPYARHKNVHENTASRIFN